MFSISITHLSLFLIIPNAKCTYMTIHIARIRLVLGILKIK